jgi:hypothetical protein
MLNLIELWISVDSLEVYTHAIAPERKRLKTPFVNTQKPNVEDMTVYNFIYSGVDETPGGRANSLKRMVGASGFEPPTSWSRTRFQVLLKSMDS